MKAKLIIPLTGEIVLTASGTAYAWDTHTDQAIEHTAQALAHGQDKHAPQATQHAEEALQPHQARGFVYDKGHVAGEHHRRAV